MIPTDNPSGVMKRLTVWPHSSFLFLRAFDTLAIQAPQSLFDIVNVTQAKPVAREFRGAMSPYQNRTVLLAKAATERNCLRLSGPRYEDNRPSLL